MGWGDYLAAYFNSQKINIVNQAVGGTRRPNIVLERFSWTGLLETPALTSDPIHDGHAADEKILMDKLQIRGIPVLSILPDEGETDSGEEAFRWLGASPLRLFQPDLKPVCARPQAAFLTANGDE
jgi:hypothetical protein